jgi:hypothetical protein
MNEVEATKLEKELEVSDARRRRAYAITRSVIKKRDALVTRGHVFCPCCAKARDVRVKDPGVTVDFDYARGECFVRYREMRCTCDACGLNFDVSNPSAYPVWYSETWLKKEEDE